MGAGRAQGQRAAVRRHPGRPGRRASPSWRRVEPDHGDPHVPFDPVADTGGRVSLGRLLIGRPGPAARRVARDRWSRRCCCRPGPYLVQIGIDHGIARRDLRVLLIATACFVAAVRADRAGHRDPDAQDRPCWPPSATRDLRIRIFAHLQRMSLDYYTREKAGVTMTRMTSDVESLQSLLQDGFAQFLIQALTMVVVTAVLFHYNADAGADHPGAGGAAADRGVAVVPARRRPRLQPAARHHRGDVRRPRREPQRRTRGHRAQPPGPQHRRAPRGGRRVPGRQRLDRPDQRDLRPRHVGDRADRDGGACCWSAAGWCCAGDADDR